MRHRASRRFWRCCQGLPKEVRQLADRSYALLKADPGHRSLHFKKVDQPWSARIGLHDRALAVEQSNDLVWFWIGSQSLLSGITACAARVTSDEAATPRVTLTHGLTSTSGGSTSVPGCPHDP